MRDAGRFWGGLLGAASVLGVDQITKHTVRLYLEDFESLYCTSFFNLVLFYNEGAAFSFLATASGWQRPFFIVLAIAASMWFTVLLWQQRAYLRCCVGLSLMIGGALGNLWDRLVLGKVVDFLEFHWRSYYWPAFNFADSALVSGAFLWVFYHRSAETKSLP